MEAHRPRLRLLLLYALIAAPAVVIGAIHAMESNNNSPVDWVDADFHPRASYDQHCELFGPGDVVVMSWPGATVQDERLDRLSAVIRTAPVFRDDNGEWLFSGVVSGREALAQLGQAAAFAEGLSLTPDEASARLRGYLIGPDGQTTAVVVTFGEQGLKRRERLVGLLRQAAHDFCGVAPGEVRMAGPVIDGLSVDQASRDTLSRYAAPSAALVFALCWFNLRSLRAAVVVFGLAMFCQGATLALVYYSGESMSALLVVLPPLIQVLAVSGGVHLTNYYFDLSDITPTSKRIAEAIRAGWLPCALSSATTAIGMASLMASRLEPIRLFGAYSAAGVLLTLGVLLGLLPACYTFWPARRSRRGLAPTGSRTLGWEAWARLTSRWAPALTVLGIGAVVVGGWQAASIQTSVRIETMFAADSRVIEDYRWIEEHLGPTVPLEVTLSFDNRSPLGYRDRLTLVSDLSSRLAQEPGLSKCISAASCVPPFPEVPPEVLQQAEHEAVLQLGPVLDRIGLWRRTPAGEHWRLTTRTSALGSADYGKLLERVRRVVAERLNQYPAAVRTGLATNTTGVMPLVHEIQGQLLSDLLSSFAAALALIVVVMTLAQAGIAAGVLAMVPNVFPLALFFGWLGYRGHPIDIGVVMTASVALGIAVDDTLHFLTFYRRALPRSTDRTEAVGFAMRHCGPAMIQTSICCGLGLLVFAMSDFLPTSRFASGMAILLGLALVGDLVVLPALLLGPLGRFLAAAPIDSEPADEPADEPAAPLVAAA
ncbi:MMPL family protein [Posidoniimonas polymericola]|uniref:MMPL family protein n=1 Tax=Posidoniimonas polymericola TaxID=2528002 RepID=A0A5C5YKU9_9BACT|nr:MMPL family transporter [Posidoniimonas polymericola]TWT75540.1 MMPL family protein [Posidoniimonas polymericola]